MTPDPERQEAVVAAPESVPVRSPLEAAAAGIVDLGFTYCPSDRTTPSQMRFTRSEGEQAVVVGLDRGSKDTTAWVSVSIFGVGRKAVADMSPTEVQVDHVSSVLSAHLTTHGLSKGVRTEAESTLDGSAA